MPEVNQPPPSLFSVSDILRALFKHKGKILILTLLGLVSAAAVFFLFPPTFVSQAKLLVRYVVERSGVDPTIDTSTTGGRNPQMTDSIIDSEAQILSSWDLAVQTAEAIGPKKLLPNASNPAAIDAAVKISEGLAVEVRKGSNILSVSYRDRHPELAPLILNELITRYFVKHLEVHRSAGAFDFVTQQTDQVRAQLNQTEDALRPLREKAGIISLATGTAALDAELAKTQDELHDAEAQLAEQKARVEEMGVSVSSGASPASNSANSQTKPNSISGKAAANAPATSQAQSNGAAQPKGQASNSDILQYQALLGQLQKLHETEAVLRSKYTDANTIVQTNRRQIKEAEAKRADLEEKYPSLPDTVRSLSRGGGGGGGNQGLDPSLEKARLAGFEARVTALKERLNGVQEKINQLSELRPQIAELERKEQLEEANYKYFQATLEKARIDEALDPSKMPNISAVQKASPPYLDTAKRNKIAGGLAAGGLGLGVAIALLLELLLNRTVKAPAELENQLGIPLLLSIPYRPNGLTDPALPSPGDADNSSALALPRSEGLQIAPWDANHFVRPYAEAIRDRLNLYFERHQMTHKPKLIGVTALTKGAGTSTLAAGLAAALSEVGDGKVLLVDVKLGPGEVHPFFKGRPAASLPAVLAGNGATESAAENLYLATVGSSTAGLAQLGLKKFFDMMPNLKASDFDYIIFDMPPLTQTSPTLGMSGFMDKMLMVVEAEETSRDVVKRSYRHLVVERKNVSVVFNKARSYTPRWLDGANALEG